ncbi:MAG: ROK family protein [Bacteroidota bacterium]
MNLLDPNEKILAIDIGGSRIKATILDTYGEILHDYVRVQTPASAGPEDVLQAIEELTKEFRVYSKVSVGFPGYVKNGVVYTAPNLSTEKWKGFDFKKGLSKLLKQPVRVVNDADMQGLGIAAGKGLEMVVTLGTGFGTALLMDGILLPHLEVAHHPLSKERDYDQYIGKKALDEVGIERWNKRVKFVIEVLITVFNYDHLYISGGNAKRINFKIDENIFLVSNMDGIKGGANLWHKDHFNV